MSTGVEGLLHEAVRDPAEAAGRRTLPRGTSGALGRSDSTGDQRKDQQALKDLEVWQRSLRHGSFSSRVLLEPVQEPIMSYEPIPALTSLLCLTGGSSDWIHAGSPHLWAGWKQ